MANKNFTDVFLRNLGHSPTEGQADALKMIAGFIENMDVPEVFVLRGYAGTGKTTIVRSLIQSLRKEPKPGLVLMASTGKASKVLSRITGSSASTVHREIYHVKTKRDGSMKFSLKKNESTETLFIVDEASMISPGSDFEFKHDGKSLMEDLLEYVYSAYRCKLLFIGDEAQLPPVGSELSPALDPHFIDSVYGFSVKTYLLKDVVRQDSMSGILENATRIRELYANETDYTIRFTVENSKDVFRVENNEFGELAGDLFGRGSDASVIVCRSNKRSVMLNKYIRERILGYTEILECGEQLMVVRNNYNCLPENSPLVFIANGEVLEIQRIIGYEEKFGFRYARAELIMTDGEKEEVFESLLLLDTLWSDQPSLSYDDYKKLYQEVFNYYKINGKSGKKLKEKVMEDPHFNALQVKYSHAVTCHKTQGGQWEKVVIDNYFYPNSRIGADDLRWLYTAFTRAIKKVYLLNFSPVFFD